VSDFKDYQKRAADCLCLAQQVSDPTNKAMMLEMAQTWVRLAEQELAKQRASEIDPHVAGSTDGPFGST
jgi:hypothetical protein